MRDMENLRKWRRENFKKKYYADIEKSRAKKREAYQKSLKKNAKRVHRLKREMSQRLRDADPAYQEKYRAYRATRKEHYREYIKKYMREWRKKHPRKTKQHMKNSYRKNPIPFFEGAARRRAKKQQAEGTHNYAEWIELLKTHKFLCFYCKKKLSVKNATRDHLVPLSRGGSDFIKNITPACRRCNCTKGTMTSEEYFQSSHGPKHHQ